MRYICARIYRHTKVLGGLRNSAKDAQFQSECNLVLHTLNTGNITNARTDAYTHIYNRPREQFHGCAAANNVFRFQNRFRLCRGGVWATHLSTHITAVGCSGCRAMVCLGFFGYHNSINQFTGYSNMLCHKGVSRCHTLHLNYNLTTACLCSQGDFQCFKLQGFLFYCHIAVFVGSGSADDSCSYWEGLIEKPLFPVELHNANNIFLGC